MSDDPDNRPELPAATAEPDLHDFLLAIDTVRPGHALAELRHLAAGAKDAKLLKPNQIDRNARVAHESRS